jgi:hypothetical protein
MNAARDELGDRSHNSGREWTARKYYKPETARILDRAWEIVNSVDYKVSLRWLFYRLLQEGFYTSKKDYKVKCAKLVSRARHTFENEWRPDTLSDGTRQIILRAGGYETPAEASGDLRRNVLSAADIVIDHFFHQKNYVEIWFEANAMSAQFERYAPPGIDLVPMGGNPSIPFKWEIAKHLAEAAKKYGKPIVVLYFGDADKAGRKILDNLAKDIRKWAGVPFEIYWCGLTKAQIEKYKIPPMPEKPGYQWEALPDKGARDIITSAAAHFVDPEIVAQADRKAERFAKEWKKKIGKILDDLDK